ncbi:uncharacterized protein LOC136064131 [Quercus suber]|uniref:uncharacterized protein LOC136064131 n=1 Tax=Quercus suber TaxID=58331 RepID=UPI0032DF693E
MDRSQSLKVPPFFYGNNYAFWKVRMRAFLCSIDDAVWDAVEVGWTRLVATKSTWDKTALTVANANSKALNAIFCGVSPEEFHRISYITIAKEAWEILETTYEGTKKVKDTKLQMLTTRFEELKMSEDESFNSFYSKLNEVVVGKFNLGEKMKDSKITYELSLPTQKKSKSLALKTIDERVVSHYSSEEDAVDKDVAYLVKNFRKHFKKECPNYLKSKGKFYATTLSDSDSSNSDSEESCDREGNYSAFMTIAHVESSDDLGSLVKELGKHSDLESIGIVEESEDEEVGEAVELQETYNSLLEKIGEYAKVANAAIKKMKRAEEDYRILIVQYKETKCEVEKMNGKLLEAYSKICFLEHEVLRANAQVDRVSSKKLNEMLAHKNQSQTSPEWDIPKGVAHQPMSPKK